MKELNLVRVRLLDNLQEITQLTALARAIGWHLVCNACKRESEPLMAILTIPGEPSETYGYCGSCYREIAGALAGSIV